MLASVQQRSSSLGTLASDVREAAESWPVTSFAHTLACVMGELLVVLAKLEGACEFSGLRGRLAAIHENIAVNDSVSADNDMMEAEK